jgi:hypothetical protein
MKLRGLIAVASLIAGFRFAKRNPEPEDHLLTLLEV